MWVNMGSVLHWAGDFIIDVKTDRVADLKVGV